MDFSELISDFSERHGVDGLAIDDGAAALDIDGTAVTLVASGESLLVTAEIGEPPTEGAAAFADLLLEASLASEVFFAKTPETGKYVAVSRIALAGVDGDAFDAALESLVNQAETWRKLLADFRPAASEAEVNNATPSFGNSGFMQV